MRQNRWTYSTDYTSSGRMGFSLSGRACYHYTKDRGPGDTVTWRYPSSTPLSLRKGGVGPPGWVYPEPDGGMTRLKFNLLSYYVTQVWCLHRQKEESRILVLLCKECDESQVPPQLAALTSNEPVMARPELPGKWNHFREDGKDHSLSGVEPRLLTMCYHYTTERTRWLSPGAF